MRILLADDDDTFALPLCRGLERLGDVGRVRDGEAARASLLASPTFDFALCHVDLPRLDGYRLLQEMRSLRPDAARRLVFYARSPDTLAARAVARLHVRPLLVVPFTMARIAAVFEEALRDER